MLLTFLSLSDTSGKTAFLDTETVWDEIKPCNCKCRNNNEMVTNEVNS
ncbi:MAG: hypothetical protein GX270_15845 [Clostridiaceae bacterium]|nr:hypothetical protein [Clostridiaceae bacterium]